MASPLAPLSPSTVRLASTSPVRTWIAARCAYTVSTSPPWSIHTTFPYPPMVPANRTRPGAMVHTSVPAGTRMSTPRWISGRSLRQRRPKGDVMGPSTGQRGIAQPAAASRKLRAMTRPLMERRARGCAGYGGAKQKHGDRASGRHLVGPLGHDGQPVSVRESAHQPGALRSDRHRCQRPVPRLEAHPREMGDARSAGEVRPGHGVQGRQLETSMTREPEERGPHEQMEGDERGRRIAGQPQHGKGLASRAGQRARREGAPRSDSHPPEGGARAQLREHLAEQIGRPHGRSAHRDQEVHLQRARDLQEVLQRLGLVKDRPQADHVGTELGRRRDQHGAVCVGDSQSALHLVEALGSAQLVTTGQHGHPWPAVDPDLGEPRGGGQRERAGAQ